MRAMWFAVGILVVTGLGLWLFLPSGSPVPDSDHNRQPSLSNDTDLTQPAISAAEATAHPQLYQNYRTCMTGYYQQSFNFQAMAERADLRTLTVTPPLIWIDLTVPTRTLECTIGLGNVESCFGQMTLCGIFSYSSNGGFGPGGKYDYQLGVQHASVNQSVAPSNVHALDNTNTP